MSSTDLHVTDADGVRTLELDGPTTRNAITTQLVARIRDAVLGVPDDVRAIVVTGRGGAFCSGLDLKAAMRDGLAPGPELARGLREDFHGLQKALVESDRPTIAAVDGAAAGFGCDIALACDVRICSDRAVFGEIFVKRGLMPDGGGTWLLPRIVGTGRALELFFTGDLVRADEALRIGLANQVVPAAELAAKVAQLAQRIAAGPPLVNALVKRSVYAGLDGDLRGALDREATGQLRLLGSRDFGEGVAAFIEKRSPRFRGE